MKFKTLMTIKAGVCLCFGPILLFFPAWILGLLGAAYCAGAALVGNLLLTWLARSAEKGTARTAIVWNLFVYDAIGLVATLVLVVAKVLNPLGLGIAAIYLFFTAGFGYFALRKEKAV